MEFEQLITRLTIWAIKIPFGMRLRHNKKNANHRSRSTFDRKFIMRLTPLPGQSETILTCHLGKRRQLLFINIQSI